MIKNQRAELCTRTGELTAEGCSHSSRAAFPLMGFSLSQTVLGPLDRRTKPLITVALGGLVAEAIIGVASGVVFGVAFGLLRGKTATIGGFIFFTLRFRSN
jgi:hypothetical protein